MNSRLTRAGGLRRTVRWVLVTVLGLAVLVGIVFMALRLIQARDVLQPTVVGKVRPRLDGPIVPIYDYDPAVEPARFAREADVVATPDGVIYAAFITDAPGDLRQCQQSVRVFRSTDAGMSWRDDGLPAPAPWPAPCDQVREGCRPDQLMDPILAVAADGSPRLALIDIYSCGSTVARAARGREGWSRPVALIPTNEAIADGSYVRATADGNEYYSWSVGLPLSFGGKIAVCPQGDCSAPSFASISSNVEFGGLKLYDHPEGGVAAVWSKSVGLQTALFYRRLKPDGTWDGEAETSLTGLYSTSVVAIGLRAFSFAFVPRQSQLAAQPDRPHEAVVAFIVNTGRPGARSSFLGFRRSVDGAMTWSETIYVDGGRTNQAPQREILQFPSLAASPVTGHVAVLYQMRDMSDGGGVVHTYARIHAAGAWGPAVQLSREQPSSYPNTMGAWRFGEYNGLAALPDGCYLAAWESVSGEGPGKGQILTRRFCSA